jgi:hypothetical protein
VVSNEIAVPVRMMMMKMLLYSGGVDEWAVVWQ